MQPLERTYFKSLKCAYRSECDSWTVANPAKRISFFNVAAIFGRAFLKTASPDKAVRGFEVCGLWPFNENVLTEEDFVATKVTEEQQPSYQHKDGESQTQHPLPSTDVQSTGCASSNMQSASEEHAGEVSHAPSDHQPSCSTTPDSTPSGQLCILKQTLLTH